ncbi:MAG: hypothetical protein ACQGVK_00150 [Myxococcota bacterium]
MKKTRVATRLALVLMLPASLLSCHGVPVINLALHQLLNLPPGYIRTHGIPHLELVELSGKINHSGMDFSQFPQLDFFDYHATVPDVNVWIAEHPFTKKLGIRSDETGWWRAYVLKLEGVDLEASFVYEREGWVTTQSNRITIADEDDTDLAIQYIDPYFFDEFVKPVLEYQLTAFLGYPLTLDNAMVVTVGKSWASLHDDRLPHGDPGALAALSPSLAEVGPLYFNEDVLPDVTYTATSVDGGVGWVNVPGGEYEVTAQKPGVSYEPVRFFVHEPDADADVTLYIATPPDSLEGSNDSGPGEW